MTAAPDVAVSTNLGGWINRAGVFSRPRGPDRHDVKRPLVWEPGPAGRHIELGISEMNLFLWLSQFGLTGELFGERLAPIGSVYDPFIARGLDALIYALYVKSRFVLVGTPSGVTLAPEGGAHQSTVTPSLGIELPGLRGYEPVFAREVAWTLLEGIRGCLDPDDGFATYLRLATRPIDQSLAAPVEARLGLDGWRDAVLAGGYRLIEAAEATEPAARPAARSSRSSPSGSIVPEAVEAVRTLHREEIAAEPHRRHLGRAAGRRASTAAGSTPMRRGRRDDVGHLGTLIPAGERRAPIVTVADGASHALSFIGGVFGAPVVPLGVDTFGQSGTIPDLYAYAGIDADHIVEAAILALDLEATLMGDSTTTATLTEAQKTFLHERPHAIVATIMPDGRPQLTPNWFCWDGERFWVSTLGLDGQGQERQARSADHAVHRRPEPPDELRPGVRHGRGRRGRRARADARPHPQVRDRSRPMPRSTGRASRRTASSSS